MGVARVEGHEDGAGRRRGICPAELSVDTLDGVREMSRLVAAGFGDPVSMLSTLTRSIADALSLGARSLETLAGSTLDPRPRVPPRRSPTERPVAAPVVLQGRAGEWVYGAFVIESRLPEPADVEIDVSDVVDAHHRPTPVELILDPDRVYLEPGREVVVNVRAKVPRSLAPGSELRGTIRAPGLGSAAIPVVVRRR
jgi:hypothetical protein